MSTHLLCKACTCRGTTRDHNGTVTTAGYSTTNLLTPVPGASSDSTSFARNWGKHVVVGRFTVPEVGAELTTVLLDVAYAGNEGQLLFRMGGDEASFAPDVSTPGWGGVEDNAQFSFSFAAGSSVLFGFGIEPGTGIGGNFSATQTSAYPDSVTFGQFSLSYVNSTAPIPVPEPEIYAMLGIGLGLIGWVGRRKKLKESAAA